MQAKPKSVISISLIRQLIDRLNDEAANSRVGNERARMKSAIEGMLPEGFSFTIKSSAPTDKSGIIFTLGSERSIYFEKTADGAIRLSIMPYDLADTASAVLQRDGVAFLDLPPEDWTLMRLADTRGVIKNGLMNDDHIPL